VEEAEEGEGREEEGTGLSKFERGERAESGERWVWKMHSMSFSSWIERFDLRPTIG
jgi:hypothetical protein